MKQTEMIKALAIVNIFETGTPFGNFSTVAVLNDGAGISYGISQFTHRSGALAAVVERYLELDGEAGGFVLQNALPNLRRTEPFVIRGYSKDERVKKALKAAAVTREMRVAQLQVAFERYSQPAGRECERLGFVLPLSVAVVCDSMIHGSYKKIRDRVRVTASAVPEIGTPKGATLRYEKAWITAYVRERDRWLASIPRLNATRYRTRFFLNQIMLGSWDLKLPLNVNGFWLRDEHIENLLKFADESIGIETAAGPNSDPYNTSSNSLESPTSSRNPTLTPQARLPLERVGSPTVRKGAKGALANARASDTPSYSLEGLRDNFDRVDAIVTGIATRTDRVKSLWTTVFGTIWQAAWAVFGFLTGLPRVLWLAVSVIAAVLTLVYLYRQIELGRIREQQKSL